MRLSPQKYWRMIPSRYRLEVYRCKKCGKLFFPKRLVCDSCRGREFELVQQCLTGKVLTYTVLHSAPPGFKKDMPYIVGVVELDNGVRLTAQIADIEPERVKTGMRVYMEFRRIGETGKSGVIHYGYKAVPVE